MEWSGVVEWSDGMEWRESCNNISKSGVINV
jgi:hypothetical protein